MNSDALLSERQVAEMVGLSLATLRRWRAKKQGPAFAKLGASSVRYRYQDVMAWIESRVVATEEDVEPWLEQ
jgi:excisionase family DNA binding protein